MPRVKMLSRCRNLDDPTTVVKFYFSNAPAKTPLTEFVRISGMRWPIETIFEENMPWPIISWFVCASIFIKNHLL